jgi:raffinose/stachyose/melibiose transport system permease protein/N-acetylglucosamine transport system permease protein
MTNVKKKINLKDTGGIMTRKTRGEKILYTIMFFVFFLQSATLIVPVLWMIMSSFKGALEYMGGYAFDLPEKWLFSNYSMAFDVLNVGNTNFFGMIFNSLWYTGIATFLGIFIPAATGYVMAKYKFPGKEVIFSVAIISMVIPIVGATASRMKIIASLGVYDSPLYVVVSYLGGFGGSFLVYYGFFKALSWSYAEAVMIDGGGHFTIFFKVMLPQAAPMLLTYAITGAIANWNEYQTMILYLPSFPTLASGLFEYKDNAVRAANFPVYFAGLILSVIPTITLFCIFSNRIMTSISIGGLKG